jgi:hypothetical protein
MAVAALCPGGLEADGRMIERGGGLKRWKSSGKKENERKVGN